MRLRATVTTDHPIIFISDPAAQWELPPGIGSGSLWASKSCIAVGTMVPTDGETTIELSVSISCPLAHLIFDGELETPGRKITVAGSDTVPILSMDVREPVTPVKVWANDLREPDYIQILAEADFSDVLPYEKPGPGQAMDRPTAERLAQAVQKLTQVEAEFAGIAAAIKDFSQRGRVNLCVTTAIHDIQETIFGEIASEFPDLRTDKGGQ